MLNLSPILYLLPYKHWNPYHILVPLGRLQTVGQAVLSSHRLSTPGLLICDQKALRCGASFEEEDRGNLHCLSRLICHPFEVLLLQYISRALLAFPLVNWVSSQEEPLRIPWAEDGSMFKTVLCHSSLNTALCAFPIVCLCFCTLEHSEIQG